MLTENVLDFVVLNLLSLCRPQNFSLHYSHGKANVSDPVSIMAVSSIGGVPTLNLAK